MRQYYIPKHPFLPNINPKNTSLRPGKALNVLPEKALDGSENLVQNDIMWRFL